MRPEHAEAHGVDCVAIGKIVRTVEVPRAMVRAFEGEPGEPLASRLVAAVVAGDAAGGEFAPVVSAALLVCDRERFPYVDLRVDAHAAPLAELARLWRIYAPMAADYVLRAISPDAAALYVAPPAKPSP